MFKVLSAINCKTTIYPRYARAPRSPHELSPSEASDPTPTCRRRLRGTSFRPAVAQGAGGSTCPPVNNNTLVAPVTTAPYHQPTDEQPLPQLLKQQVPQVACEGCTHCRPLLHAGQLLQALMNDWQHTDQMAGFNRLCEGHSTRPTQSYRKTSCGWQLLDWSVRRTVRVVRCDACCFRIRDSPRSATFATMP